MSNGSSTEIKPRKSQSSRTKKKSSGVKIVIIVLVVLLLLCVCGGGVLMALSFLGSGESTTDETSNETYVYETIYGDKDSDNLILSIKIDGIILNEEPEVTGFLSGPVDAVYGYSIKEELIRAAKNDKVKAVILEISSPGGTVTGSKVIADGIEYFKENSDKPIITYGQGVVASGAYWVSAVTDEIVLDYGSSIGSIGVLFGPFQYYENVTAVDGGLLEGGVVTQDGIDQYYITAGEYKDSGNPYRQLTQEEVEVYQESVDDNYDDFVIAISSARDITEESLREDVKALIYGNEQALELGLIDSNGSKGQSYQRIVDLAELGEDYRFVRERDDMGIFNELLYSTQMGSTFRESYLAGKAYEVGNDWFIGKVLAYYPEMGF